MTEYCWEVQWRDKDLEKCRFNET